MPSLAGGAAVYVRGTSRSTFIPTSKSSSSATVTPPDYSTIFPPSPPSSPPTSNLFDKIESVSVLKPLLTPRSSADPTTDPLPQRNILTAVFPAASPIHALPSTATPVSHLVQKWQAAVLENPAMGTRTLYVLVGGESEEVNLRENVCGVLELAEEEYGCTGVVMCLEKNTPDLGASSLPARELD